MTEILWTAADAAAATDGKTTGQWKAYGVSIDSRSVAEGDLFIALKGPNFDGHAFVAAALAGGAAAALVHDVPQGLENDSRLLVVGDTMDGLYGLARAARARSAARIVAVTGSVGKTGTKDMLRLVLTAQGPTHASVGSFNNHWGVPLTLARMPASCVYGVFELGMNHAGELGPLSRLVRPHVAVITTVEAVHLEFFASVTEIAKAKAEIFEGLEPGGTAVLNRDNPHYALLRDAALAQGAAIIRTFGSHIESEARLLDVAVDPGATSLFALIEDHPLAYKVGVAGVHWAANSLSVLMAVSSLGGNVAAAARALAAMEPPKGRGQRHKIVTAEGSFEIIDESYNASPVSMQATIATLGGTRPGKSGRRIAVLGDMLELGGHALQAHRGLADVLIEHGIDVVFTAGPFMATLHEALPAMMRGGHGANAALLAPIVRDAVRPGDVVVVKGSAGSKMALVVQELVQLSDAPKRVANGH